VINKDKKYQTREGLKVRIYAIDGYGYFPIHGAIKHKEKWRMECWTKNGHIFDDIEDKNDLIEIKI